MWSQAPRISVLQFKHRWAETLGAGYQVLDRGIGRLSINMEKTLGIIKPDAVSRNLAGAILKLAESAGLEICALKMLHLSKKDAQEFYQVHKERPFFDSLTDFMSESPIVAIIYKAENAIATWRKVMGATNPGEADVGTIRNLYGQNIERNSVHGSDSPESAAFETRYFFSEMEECG